MTREESKQFVSEVLMALWPHWKPKDYETEVWVNKLTYYGYDDAKKAVNNAFFSEERRGNLPPAGKIIQVLKAISQLEQGKGQGSILLYTIIKERLYAEGKRPPMYGRGIWGKSRSEPEIDKNSDLMRTKFNNLYGENHIVIKKCEEAPF